MRWLVAGVDGSGHSCVIDRGTFEGGGTQAVPQAQLFHTEQTPSPPRPPGRGTDRHLGIEPGLTEWRLLRWEPDYEVEMHHTDTIDFDTVLAGEVTLLLDDSAHELYAGDCVVIKGVDHAWRVGPVPCVLSVVLLGTPPPPS